MGNCGSHDVIVHDHVNGTDRTPPTTLQELPLGLSVTKEFLEFAFNRKVKYFVVRLGTNPGDNYLSIMHAVTLVFEGEHGRRHYLIKCYPNHPARRKMLDQSKVFEKELFIYHHFLPKLKQLVKRSSTSDEEILGLATAPFHGGNVATSPSDKWKYRQWSTKNFLIMTDLRKHHFVMADRIQGLDMEHAMLTVKELAKWHALAWALKEKGGWPRLSDKYPNLIDHTYSDDGIMADFKTVFAHANANALLITEESLGHNHPVHLAFQKAVVGDVTNIMRKFIEADGMSEDDYEDMLRVKPEVDENYCKEPWLTGAHGDCWLNNMLFRYDFDNVSNSLKPFQVLLIDFQLYREACPTTDLAYFLSSSVRAPVRIPGKEELLHAYHDAFLLICEELNVKPFPGFSFSSLKRRYRRTELFGLLMGLSILTFILRPVEEAIDMDKSVDGNENVSDMFSKVVHDSDKNMRLKDELIPTLLDLYRNGVI